MKRLAVHYDSIVAQVENFLLQRRTRIAGERQALINQEMAGYTKLFGLIRVGPFTEEEAIKRLQNEDRDMFLGNRWDDVEHTASSWEDRANAILTACDLAYKDQTCRRGDGRIWLDDNDIRLVRGEVKG